MNVLSLFAGIGGFDLGLESVGGFRTIAFCEIEPYPRAVLAARWPGVPCYPDIRTITAAQLQADGLVRPDLITGGFPCQDISSAGGGAGLDGERSKLWWEMHRLIGEVRPRWVIAENSPSLRGRGADRVLGSMESLGYSCWPLVVGAVHAGAWHRRQRVWILAHLDGVREHEPAAGRHDERLWAADLGQPDADAHSEHGRKQQFVRISQGARARNEPNGRSGDAPDADSAELRNEPWRSGRARRPGESKPRDDGPSRDSTDAALLASPDWYARPDGAGNTQEQPERRSGATGEPAGPAQPNVVRVVHGVPAGLDDAAGLDPSEALAWWPMSDEPSVPRTMRDVPHRVDRIAGLGNAVVPEVAAMFGRAIRAVEAQLQGSS